MARRRPQCPRSACRRSSSARRWCPARAATHWPAALPASWVASRLSAAAVRATASASRAAGPRSLCTRRPSCAVSLSPSLYPLPSLCVCRVCSFLLCVFVCMCPPPQHLHLPPLCSPVKNKSYVTHQLHHHRKPPSQSTFACRWWAQLYQAQLYRALGGFTGRWALMTLPES